jgi:hypothetical protein
MEGKENHMKDTFRFQFKPVDVAHSELVHKWLLQPHVAQWFYGQGLQNTFNHLNDTEKKALSHLKNSAPTILQSKTVRLESDRHLAWEGLDYSW